MKKSTRQHLRFPFSLFLLPVFLFAVASVGSIDIYAGVLAFLILHLLIYPASNGYNSYFDKDKKAIGGLKNPPPVSKELYYWALVLDGLGIGLSLLISVEFALMILVYGLVSKAYSHPSTRLKRRPVIGLLSVGIFQGYFIFLATIHAVASVDVLALTSWHWQFPAILCTILLLGSYPMTQIYQHEEDAERNDRTLSLLLGIRGTFHFTAIIFTLAMVGFMYYFFNITGPNTVIIFLLMMLPTLIYFLTWYSRVVKDIKKADHKSTMRLNMISSFSLILFFLVFWIQNGLP